jgi:hypothetical protein
VAQAVKRAFETRNANHILIWLPKGSEKEMRSILNRALKASDMGGMGREVAEDWALENAVRLHRAGEGAAYHGIKPAGLDEGPIVPKAEKAIETGDPSKVIDLIAGNVRKELMRRFKHVRSKRDFDPDDVKAGREYVQAFIHFVVFAHHLNESLGEEEHAE